MEKTLKTLGSSELYRKIDALNLAPSIRAEAFAALQLAETLASAIISLSAKLTPLGATLPSRLSDFAKAKSTLLEAPKP